VFVDEINNNSLVLIKIKEGRKHQIRVQMAMQLGNPILNDCKYGATRTAQDDHIYLHSLLYRIKAVPQLSDLFSKCETKTENGSLEI
jgi:23S rRNA-/tRNA-specific pseudouridylate synthase